MANERAARDHYDRNILPAETAAREEREGDNFKRLPDKDENLDTTGGFTVDQEGLMNNYAIEPEMYYEEPGDLREKEEREKAERVQELKDVNENDETGKLTMDGDQRSKGPGLI